MSEKHVPNKKKRNQRQKPGSVRVGQVCKLIKAQEPINRKLISVGAIKSIEAERALIASLYHPEIVSTTNCDSHRTHCVCGVYTCKHTEVILVSLESGCDSRESSKISAEARSKVLAKTTLVKSTQIEKLKPLQ